MGTLAANVRQVPVVLVNGSAADRAEDLVQAFRAAARKALPAPGERRTGRFRSFLLLREEIQHTGGDPGQIDDEIGFLLKTVAAIGSPNAE
jgi:hypothetical protein